MGTNQTKHDFMARRTASDLTTRSKATAGTSDRRTEPLALGSLSALSAGRGLSVEAAAAPPSPPPPPPLPLCAMPSEVRKAWPEDWGMSAEDKLGEEGESPPSCLPVVRGS